MIVIHSIEPSPSTAEALRRDLRRCHLDAVVQVHEVAAGDSPGRMFLRLEDDPAGATIRSLDPAGSAVGAVRVRVVRSTNSYRTCDPRS